MENILKDKRKRKQFLPSILNLLNFKQMVTSDSNKEEISEPRVFNMHLFQVFTEVWLLLLLLTWLLQTNLPFKLALQKCKIASLFSLSFPLLL